MRLYYTTTILDYYYTVSMYRNEIILIMMSILTYL